MPGMDDMARMMAASGPGGGSMDTGSPDMEAQDPNAPEDGPEGGGDPCEMIEEAATAIMSAAEQLPGDVGEKVRKHVEALLELCQQAEAAGGQGSPTGAEPTPDGQSDQVEGTTQGGGSVGGSPVSMGA